MENAITDQEQGWNDEPAPLDLGGELESPAEDEAPRRRWPLIAAVLLLGGGAVGAVVFAGMLVLGGLGYAWYSTADELPAGWEQPIGEGRSDADLVIMPDPAKDGGDKGDKGSKGDKEAGR